MGITGAGKSSFIASATGFPVGVGHTLESRKVPTPYAPNLLSLIADEILSILKDGNSLDPMGLQ
jgi:hypothetical protein